MARPLRIEYPGAVYHVMNRGLARQVVFRDPDDFETFLRVLGETHALWGVEVLAYCLMGNHYHLCLRTPVANLGRVMRHVNGLYTQRFNRVHRRDGPLFRGRYKAIVVEAEAYLAEVIRYIHLNPVKAKLVKSPEKYHWSSHARYLKPSSAPPWLAVREVLGGFGTPRGFHEFVLEGNEEALEAFYTGGRQVPVLGREGFGRWVRTKIRPLSQEHPRYERIKVRPSVRQVVQRVASVFDVKSAAIWQGRRGEANDARKVAMYLVKRLCDLTLQETAARFGVKSYGVVGWACSQVRAKQAEDDRFKKRVARVELLFCPQKKI